MSAKKPLTVVLRGLISAGLTNAQAWAIVKEWYGRPDDKRSYVAYVRKNMGDANPTEWETGGEFYVYIVFRPQPDSRPFYVSRGTAARWQDEAKEAAEGNHSNVRPLFEKHNYDLPVVQTENVLTEASAMELVMALGQAIGGGKAGPLVSLWGRPELDEKPKPKRRTSIQQSWFANKRRWAAIDAARARKKAK